MSTSLVHVMTIIGEGAQEVEEACNKLLNRRVPVNDGEYGSDDWSTTNHQVIADFSRQLIGAAHELPVVYYAQYLDAWTTADSTFWMLDWNDGQRRHIAGDWFGVTYYPSRFSEDLLSQISKRRGQKTYRTQTENRWFLDHLFEAISSALWIESPFLVVAISQHLGQVEMTTRFARR